MDEILLDHVWLGTWHQRSSTVKHQIGLRESEGKALTLLLSHYHLIVYLGFSLWRKLIYQPGEASFGRVWPLDPWIFRDDNQAEWIDMRCKAGYLAQVALALPAIHLETRKPVALTRFDDFSIAFVTAMEYNQIDVVMTLVKEFRLDVLNIRTREGNCLNHAALRNLGQILGHLLSTVNVDSFQLDHQAQLIGSAAGFDSYAAAEAILTHPRLQATKKDFINRIAEDDDSTTALTEAVYATSSNELISLLVAHGADVEKPDGAGRLPVTVAASPTQEKGPAQLACMKHLIQSCGANPNAVDGMGDVALGLASADGDEAMVRLLLDLGAHVDGGPRSSPTVHKTTPLHKAVAHYEYGVAKVLLAHGADENALDDNGHCCNGLKSEDRLKAIGFL